MNFPGANGPGDSGKIPGLGGSTAHTVGSMFPSAATSGLNEQEAAMVKMVLFTSIYVI